MGGANQRVNWFTHNPQIFTIEDHDKKLDRTALIGGMMALLGLIRLITQLAGVRTNFSVKFLRFTTCVIQQHLTAECFAWMGRR